MKVKKACLFLCIVIAACTEEYPHKYPIIKTFEVTGITDEQAIFKANILNVKDPENVLEYGFVYNQQENNHTFEVKIPLTGSLEEGMISYQNIHDLRAGATYYVRAFVKTDKYTIYGNEVSFRSQGSKAPVITDFEPKQMLDGNELVITGENFSINKSDNEVTIGDNIAQLISVARTSLKVRVPRSYEWGDMPVKVRVDNKETTANQSLQILGPIIHSVSPAEVLMGDIFVIQGENFVMDDVADGVILRGVLPNGSDYGYYINVIEHSLTTIKARVPSQVVFLGSNTVCVRAGGKFVMGSAILIKQN